MFSKLATDMLPTEDDNDLGSKGPFIKGTASFYVKIKKVVSMATNKHMLPTHVSSNVFHHPISMQQILTASLSMGRFSWFSTISGLLWLLSRDVQESVESMDVASWMELPEPLLLCEFQLTIFWNKHDTSKLNDRVSYCEK